MTHQPTSVLAFHQAEQSGQLNGKRYEVAKAFATFGPGTSAEVLRKAKLDKNRNLMRARVTELADIGMLKPMPARKCGITGRKAIVWSFEQTTPRKDGKTTSATKAELVDYVAGLANLASGLAGVLEIVAETSDVEEYRSPKLDEARKLIAEAQAAIGIKTP